MNLEHFSAVTQTHRNPVTTTAKYRFVPTTEALRLLARHGWHPVRVQQARVRRPEFEGYQPHAVWLESPLLTERLRVGDRVVPPVLLRNSHQGDASRATPLTCQVQLHRYLRRNPEDSAMKKYKVTLTAEERNSLQDLIAAGKAAAKELTQARILLKADVAPGGPAWTDARIADALEVHVTTVERLRERVTQNSRWRLNSRNNNE